MRGFSIFIWCLVTAAMFYSAWRFKAPEIEADIMARVSENVHGAGGEAVAVEVDGRHVNLRGFASTPSQKADFLDTADKTYGALGPVDGLLLPRAPTRTFLSAARSQTGVVLSGVVGTTAERDMLLTQAKTAGLGEITDDLVVADGQIAWAASSKIGFDQLAALDSGHLYVSDDRQALSGTAPNADVATAAQSLGDDWQSFVAGPAIEDPRVAELTGTLATRNDQLNTLGNQIADRDDQINTLNGELVGVKDTLTARQADLSGLETKLGQKEAHIALLTRETKSKALNLADLSQEADLRGGRITELEAELAARSGEKADAEGKLAAMTASMQLLRDSGGAQTADLEAALEAKTADVTALEAELAALDTDLNGQIADRDAQLAALSEEKSGLMEQLNAQEATLETANQSLSDENQSLADEQAANASLIAGLRNEISDVKSSDADKATKIAALEAQLDDARSGASASATTVAELEIKLEAAEARTTAGAATIAGLQTQLNEANSGITTRSTTITDLEAQLTAAETSNASAIADLRTQLDEAKANATKSDAMRADAVTRGDDLDAIVADQSTQLVSLTQERDALNSKLSDFDAVQVKLGSLETSVTQKDAKIAELMASLEAQPTAAPQASSSEIQTAAQCNATARSLLDEGKINFVSNSADILEASQPLLERITGVVLACSGPDTDASVTIAGHTDSQGSEISNQALSEARAQSVASFMVNRGVDAGALQSIGFGETDPIADNATAEGRAANRRISFDFKAR